MTYTKLSPAYTAGGYTGFSTLSDDHLTTEPHTEYSTENTDAMYDISTTDTDTSNRIGY